MQRTASPETETQGVEIASLRAHVFRAAIASPVVISFGVMRDRPMVLVRAEDRDGTVGWGEIWCNYPATCAEHRASLVDSLLAGLIEGHTFATPADAFARLSEQTAVMALQSGEPGPLAQCIAGIDIALWDLTARRAEIPLWRLLGGTSPDIDVYASGLNPDAPETLAAARAADGFRAFKLKVGFGAERDAANLSALRQTLGADVALMIDANQAWTLEQARAAMPALESFALHWLEEPLRADRPWLEWQLLAKALSVPLAAGENIAGWDNFDTAIAAGALSVMQPDIAKWGGFSGCLPVARKALAAGLTVCPHWLGGGVGLLASAHFLAAIGGPGLLEVDANPNALRSLTCGPVGQLAFGRVQLSERPGLGDAPDLAILQPYSVVH